MNLSNLNQVICAIPSLDGGQRLTLIKRALTKNGLTPERFITKTANGDPFETTKSILTALRSSFKETPPPAKTAMLIAGDFFGSTEWRLVAQIYQVLGYEFDFNSRRTVEEVLKDIEKAYSRLVSRVPPDLHDMTEEIRRKNSSGLSQIYERMDRIRRRIACVVVTNSQTALAQGEIAKDLGLIEGAFDTTQIVSVPRPLVKCLEGFSAR